MTRMTLDIDEHFTVSVMAEFIRETEGRQSVQTLVYKDGQLEVDPL